MDRQQTSFIPKKTFVPESRSLVTSAPFRLAPFLSLLVLLAGVLMAGGVFLYDRLLTATLESKKETLQKNLSAFEPATIKEIQRLDKRLRATKEIINNHVAISNVFTVLERATLPTVQFQTFEYTTAGENGTVAVTMAGLSKSYGSVVNQSDIFGTTKGILNPMFTGLNLDQKGNVSFTFDASLDPEVIKYAFVIPVETGNSEDVGGTSLEGEAVESNTDTLDLEADLDALENLEDL